MEIPTEIAVDQSVYVSFVGLGACDGWEHDVVTNAETSLCSPRRHPRALPRDARSS